MAQMLLLKNEPRANHDVWLLHCRRLADMFQLTSVSVMSDLAIFLAQLRYQFQMGDLELCHYCIR